MRGAGEKKPLAAILLGIDGGKSKGSSPSKAEEKDVETESVEASKRILDAIKAGDASGLDEALRLHYELCEEEMSPDSEREEEDYS